jgi:PAS domain S-box-containing protein
VIRSSRPAGSSGGPSPRQATCWSGRDRQRLQAIFNNTTEAVLLADENSCYIDVNLATCELTGYRRAELIQMTVWDLTPNAHIEQGQQLWREFIASGQQSGEYTIQRKDGSLVEVEYQAVANILPGMHLSVIRDITERKMGEERLKKSLEEKRLLLQEVHHRVKNNLQLISSMLSLHADTVQDQLVQAIFMESKRRIRSLALIHEELYRSADFTGVHFDRHLRSLVDFLFLSYDANRRHIRFVHQVGDVALVVDQAIPCSLIVNVLVSSAL